MGPGLHGPGDPVFYFAIGDGLNPDGVGKRVCRVYGEGIEHSHPDRLRIRVREMIGSVDRERISPDVHLDALRGEFHLSPGQGGSREQEDEGEQPEGDHGDNCYTFRRKSQGAPSVKPVISASLSLVMLNLFQHLSNSSS